MKRIIAIALCLMIMVTSFATINASADTADATITVGTVAGPIAAGDEVAIPITISDWSNAYATIKFDVQYDANVLELDTIEPSDVDFSGGLASTNNNKYGLIASPSSDRQAQKLDGGEICVVYFYAINDITEATTVTLTCDVTGYTYGKEDNWVANHALDVDVVAGGVEIPSEPDITTTATVATLEGTFVAGDEIAVPVTLAEFANGYATVDIEFNYDDTILELTSIQASETGFGGALTTSYLNKFFLIASPTSEAQAAKVVGGEVCVAYFKAITDITEFTEISVAANITGYVNGAADGWVKNKAFATTVVSGGIKYVEPAIKLEAGWNKIDEDWYYADPTTLKPVSGKVEIGVVTYEFDNTGKLLSGVWANTLFGTRYYYGPDCYLKGWYTIDGKDYYFDNTYRLTGGWQLVFEGSNERNWYFFGEDGVCEDKTLKPADGIYTDRNGVAGALGGVGLSGLREINGKYYYFNFNGYAQNNGTYAGRLFLEDYEAYTGLYEKDGETYYYVNGMTAGYGLTKIDEDYYFIYWGGLVKKDGKFNITTTNCDLPAGEYEFGADGKALNGVVEREGVKYLYTNGKLASYGLYKIDDKYYFASANGEFAANGRFWVTRTYCDLPANANYTFGADGAMLDGICEVDGGLYYYKNGSTETCGLFNIDGKYYYVNWGGIIMTDGKYYVPRTACELPVGNYRFGADGAMLDGVVFVDGAWYLYNKGVTETCGLFEVDGKYYYADWGGILKVDGRFYVPRTYCDLPVGNYTFGEDGAMLDGIVDVDGTLYCYNKGTLETCGLFNIDGKYYYVDWSGKVAVDCRLYVPRTYCDLPVGNYTFGKDGAMLDGVVEIDGVKYLYNNGNTETCGLFKVDGKYYYAYWGGVIMTGKQYVTRIYCDLPEGNYTFDENGVMLNGFVTIDGVKYYYVNGNTPMPGLIEVDGDYYFVNWGGVVVVNQKFFVFDGGDYTIKMNYVFDEEGRIIG